MSKQKLLAIIPDEVIINKIFYIKGHKVMLDRDLAELYGATSRRLREQVKRNLKRFPDHFMFQLTQTETETMVSQNAIPSLQHLGGSFPYVFTEHGILQLANVLKSDRATEMSIKIIEVFVKMREMLLTHKDLLLKIEQIEKQVSSQDEKVELLFGYVKQFITENEKPRKAIGFKIQKKKSSKKQR